MTYHFFQYIIAFIGMNQLNYFYFVKLVKPVQSAYILTIAACLAAKARGISRHLNRQFSFFQ
jgi:hypothetical protein